jgi:hypothetical protein
MGYYTAFDMEVTKTEDSMLKLLRGYIGAQLSEEEQLEVTRALCSEDAYFEGYYEEERAKRSYSFCDQAWDYLVSEDTMKWYDHDDDMKQLSMQFPDYYFLLNGRGEEHDDQWRKVYHNGKIVCHQVIKMYFDEVDSFED